MFQAIVMPLLFWYYSSTPSLLPENATVEYMPKESLYPLYIADTHASNTSLNLQYVPKRGIPHTSSVRLETKLGTYLKLIRVNLDSEKALQIDFGGAMVQHSDIGEAWDIYGWDGILESALTFRYDKKFAYKFSYKHISAHKGDEYVLSHDAVREGYTRDDVTFGVRITPNESAVYYTEIGLRYNNNDAFPEEGPLSLQGGFEFTKKKYYWAVDIKTADESDWRVAVNSEFGRKLYAPNNNMNARIGVSYYTGPALLREYYGHSEQRIAAGLWLDI